MRHTTHNRIISSEIDEENPALRRCLIACAWVEVAQEQEEPPLYLASKNGDDEGVRALLMDNWSCQIQDENARDYLTRSVESRLNEQYHPEVSYLNACSLIG